MTRFALVFLWAPVLATATPPQEILKKVDEACNPFEDRKFTIRMTIREPDGSSKEAQIRIAERGRGKQRLMIYQAPADVKGMGVLVEDRNTMYIYLPSYHRVRRVAMHAKKQTFMGSDFTFDDMAQITFAPDYQARLVSDDGQKRVVLELKPKPGRDLAYSRLILHVDRETWLIEKIEYFDAENQHIKTELRSDYKPIGGVKMQTRIRMVDERTRHATDIEVTELEVNLGLSTRLFTKRGLIRGKL
jgi:outer membrane lipoprotein-sorting protein